MASASSEEAAQARIKNHMNADHTRELSHYLRYYSRLTRRSASSPWLKSIDTRGMTIAAGGLGGREFHVPFDPPLTSLSEARPRVIAMDAEARSALGLSDVFVTSYVPPRWGLDVAVFAGVAFYFFCYVVVVPYLLLPGTPLWRALTTAFPGGPRAFRWLVETIFWPVFGIHIAEALWMHRTRLIPHGVGMWSRVWWAWMGTTFFEGICAFRRFDDLIREKRAAKDAKNH